MKIGSSTTINPSVNIVMTYRPEVMMAFQKAASFTDFIKKKNEIEGNKKDSHIFIFSNVPNSTFLSLTHSFNKNDGAVLEIDMIDPEGLFEEAMVGNNRITNMMPISDNPFAAGLQAKKEQLLAVNEALEKKKSRMLSGYYIDPLASPLSNKEYNEIGFSLLTKKDTLRQEISSLEKQSATFETNKKIGRDSPLQKRRRIAASDSRVQLNRPLYVAYGVGEDLRDWSPPATYGRITNIEYSLRADGVRQLKLILVSIAIHPNLLLGVGLSPFGKAFTAGILTQGSSPQLFNNIAAKKQASDKKEEVKIKLNKIKRNAGEKSSFEGEQNDIINEYIGDSKRPSIHLAVTNAITDFIRRGSGENNVYVLLPNLDKYLYSLMDGYMKACKERVKKSITGGTLSPSGEDLVYFEAFKLVLDTLGLGVSETSTINPGTKKINAPFLPISKSIFKYLEPCADNTPGEIGKWFQNRVIKAYVQCDYDKTTSFLDKLAQISGALTTALGKEGLSVNITDQPISESDLSILQVMKGAGLIEKALTPLLIWGDRGVINSYLLGRVGEENIKQDDKKGKGGYTNDTNDERIRTKLKNYIHPITVLEGLDKNYITNIINNVMPPSWIGPFGPKNSGDKPIDDTNISITSFTKVSKNQPFQASRMPVFTYGGKNPNILSVDFDINPFYLAALNWTTPMPTPSQQLTTSIMNNGGNNTATGQMYSSMQKLLKDSNVTAEDLRNPRKRAGQLIVPDKFKKYMNDLYTPVPELDKYLFPPLFGTHSLKKAQVERLSLTKDEWIKKGEEDKIDEKVALENFYQFHWDNFCFMYYKAVTTPLSTRNMTGGVKQVISHSARMAEFVVKQAMTGSITTVPLFNLSTVRNTMLRPCQIICREPSMSESDYHNPAQLTWFSGQYEIVGFKHSISSTRADSEFYVIRGTNTGDALEQDEIGKNYFDDKDE